MAFLFTVTNYLRNLTIDKTNNTVDVASTSRSVVLNSNYTVQSVKNLADSYKGQWDSTTTYLRGDVVKYSYNEYLSLVNENLNYNPFGNNVQWVRFGGVDAPEAAFEFLQLGPFDGQVTDPNLLCLQTQGGSINVQNIGGSDGNIFAGGYIEGLKGFKVGSTQVIDDTGHWVGPAISVEDIDAEVPTVLNTAFKLTGSVFNAITTIDQIQLDSFSSSQYDTAKYLIKINDGTDIHIVEMILTYDGTDILKSEYGVITNNGALGIFATDVVNGFIRLLFTPTAASNMNIRIAKTLMAV